MGDKKQHEHLHGGNNKYAVACSIIGSIISVLMGYGNQHMHARTSSYMHLINQILADTGVMSGAMLFIKEDLHSNDTQVQVLAGILNAVFLMGVAVATVYLSRTQTDPAVRDGAPFTVMLIISAIAIFLVGVIGLINLF